MASLDRLLPAVTLADVFGTETVYTSRPSPTLNTWLGSDAAVHDAMSGSNLPVVGELPVMCSRGLTSPSAMSLLREAGFNLPSRLHSFATTDDYVVQLQALARDRRVAVQFLHTKTELHPRHWLVSSEQLSFLNNKANIAHFVPAKHLPRRQIAMRENLLRHPDLGIDLPFVIKAVTDESSGGGLDVRVCRERKDIVEAIESLRRSEQVVLEEFLEIEKNLCLDYAVSRDGRWRYLGAAEQVSGEDGRFNGNWIDPSAMAPSKAVAIADTIVDKAAAMGYFGIVGVDIALLADAGLAVFDLNFRVNGSTPGILLHHSIVQTRGYEVARLRAWHAQGSAEDFVAALHRAVRDGIFVPLYLYDPVMGGRTNARWRCAGMLLGRSREDVREKEGALAALGAQ